MNQIIIANLMIQLGKFSDIEIDENLFRHMVINSVRAHHKKYSAAYGEMVLAFDGPSSWRKDVFPYYKAARKKNREASTIDWNKLFVLINKIRVELAEIFPYPVIWVDHAEADDVIGTLVRSKEGERIMILSADKDFIQLQSQAFVNQYDPIRNVDISSNDPELYLKEHIASGDKGDGIPNILSPGDSYVTGTRCKSLTKGILSEVINKGKDALDSDDKKRYYDRNEQLIDLKFTPSEIQDKILEAYNSQQGKRKNKILDYLIEHRMKNLIELIGDF